MTGFHSHKVRTLAPSIALVLVASSADTQADGPIVVPNALESLEGSANNVLPFNFATTRSHRYQQVFSASEFGALTGPVFITHISFRPDAMFVPLFVPIVFSFDSIQINLSATRAPDDGLSTVFADNVGSNDTVVFSGPLTMTTAWTGPAAGPKEFDCIITLQVPFLYDPSAGNLLLDVRRPGSPWANWPHPFDAQSALRDGVSRVFSDPLIEGMTSPVGIADTFGLVVQFMTVPAPIPPSFPVSIDIKPGAFPNSINSTSEGSIPVAVLSSATFDAPTEVNETSLTFGRSGYETSLRFCSPTPEDVNADGFLDLVCHFQTQVAGFLSGDTVGVLKGRNLSDVLIEGTDSVNIVR